MEISMVYQSSADRLKKAVGQVIEFREEHVLVLTEDGYRLYRHDRCFRPWFPNEPHGESMDLAFVAVQSGNKLRVSLKIQPRYGYRLSPVVNPKAGAFGKKWFLDQPGVVRS